MCELLAVAWEEPKAFDTVLPWARELERLGVAGFGWGVAWIDDEGRVQRYRNPLSLAEDAAGADRLRDVRSSRFLIHLRRPSKLSTVQEADSQPFLDPAGAFAFCHNGFFERAESLRERYAGRLQGQADSEVGFCVVQDRLREGTEPDTALRDTLEKLGGTGNLGYLGGTGELLVLAGHPHNALWRFRDPGGAEVAVTALHSADESVFDLLFPEATEREPVVRDLTRVGGPVPEPQARAAS